MSRTFRLLRKSRRSVKVLMNFLAHYSGQYPAPSFGTGAGPGNSRDPIMASLFGTMSVALQSMLTQQSALEVVANNVANVNTPGYSREIANFEESPPVLSGTPNRNGVNSRGSRACATTS